MCQNSFHILPVQGISGGIVRGTQEYQFGVWVNGLRDSLQVQLKVRTERNFSYSHIIDIGRHLIHPIGWWHQNHIVHPWFTKSPEEQINSLITAIPQKNMLGRHPFDLADTLLQLRLMRIRIAVIGGGHATPPKRYRIQW